MHRARGRSLRDNPLPALLTCARGTSDQAALYFKYLVERYAGIPVASIGPSVASVYDARLQTHGMVCLTISQSGGGPDLKTLPTSAGRFIRVLSNVLKYDVFGYGPTRC